MRRHAVIARSLQASASLQLTIRGVPEDLERALRSAQRRQGTSLNQTVLTLLRRALGLSPGRPFDNGLGGLVGGWTEEEMRQMEDATSVFEQVDPGLWE